MAPDPRAPCSRVVGLLADYLEQRLSPPQHRELTRHLDNCQTCVAQLHTYRSTVSLLRSLKEEDLPPDPQRVLGAERELGFPMRGARLAALLRRSQPTWLLPPRAWPDRRLVRKTPGPQPRLKEVAPGSVWTGCGRRARASSASSRCGSGRASRGSPSACCGRQCHRSENRATRSVDAG